MNFPLLQIKNLDVSFKTDTDKVSVIKNSSFEINKGETLAIVGESGSGKTVTSLSILQLLPSSSVQYNSGEILFSENGKEQVNMLSLAERS
jgi:peptide/nickel transport system ATP-binding protein